MRTTNFNLIITFGTIIAIGITIAIYRILTLPSMVSTFLAMTIAVAVAVCIAILAGASYLVIRINHKRNLYRVDIEAKQLALDAIRTSQYGIGSQFDADHAQHILEVLHGRVIETKEPRAIEIPKLSLPAIVREIPDRAKRDYDNDK